MAVSGPTLVASSEVIIPGHGGSGGTDTITLTFAGAIPPSVPGDGTALVIFIIYGWIDLTYNPGTDTIGGAKSGLITGLSDDVVNPGGIPANRYFEVISPIGSAVSRVISDPTVATSTNSNTDFATQGGTISAVYGADANWGYAIGDSISIALDDTYDYKAAFAFLYTGDGIVPNYISSVDQFIRVMTQQAAAGDSGEIIFDSTIEGGSFIEGCPCAGPYFGSVYSDFGILDGQKMMALSVLEGGEYLVGGAPTIAGFVGRDLPATLIQDTDDIADGLGFWTAEVLKQVAAGDCNVASALVYKLWSQTYPGDGTQGADPIMQFESSPDRRVTDSEGDNFSAATGISWMAVQDLFVQAVGPVFNHRFRAGD